MEYQKFTDRNSGDNYENGIEYLAVGLVTGCYMENGAPSRSGKDYTVEYIDPFGQYHHAWRGFNEIEVSPISEEDYQHLKDCYEFIQSKRR